MNHYLFDLYGRFAGVSETVTERSTTIAPPELSQDYNWAGASWVFAPGIKTVPIIPPPSAPVIADKIEHLWQAADKYVSGYISGVAIGLLTIGVIQQKPKAMAITSWSSTVWAEYYRRKAQITVTSALDLDFSALGPMPHSVPELQAEIGL